MQMRIITMKYFQDIVEFEPDLILAGSWLPATGY